MTACRLPESHRQALELPPAIIPAKSIFLLNPAHSAFAKVEIGEPQQFEFDVRLIAKL
ncbi:MAG TPA: hypothetical protein VJR26_01015 [Candidatus Acidoferrales bacterium]|nr:hypothetical protein [Candidatus Acidoferrales bacterium]